jgi:hypothetical protein
LEVDEATRNDYLGERSPNDSARETSLQSLHVDSQRPESLAHKGPSGVWWNAVDGKMKYVGCGEWRREGGWGLGCWLCHNVIKKRSGSGWMGRGPHEELFDFIRIQQAVGNIMNHQ